MPGGGTSAGAAAGTLNTWSLHMAAWASSQHGGSVPRAHVKGGAEGSQTEAI